MGELERLQTEVEALKLYRALIRSALIELYDELKKAGDTPMNTRMMQALHRLALVNCTDRDQLSDTLQVYRLRSAMGTIPQHTLDKELLAALSSIAPFAPASNIA
jgi:hypothetical protein